MYTKIVQGINGCDDNINMRTIRKWGGRWDWLPIMEATAGDSVCAVGDSSDGSLRASVSQWAKRNGWKIKVHRLGEGYWRLDVVSVGDARARRGKWPGLWDMKVGETRAFKVEEKEYRAFRRAVLRVRRSNGGGPNLWEEPIEGFEWPGVVAIYRMKGRCDPTGIGAGKHDMSASSDDREAHVDY